MTRDGARHLERLLHLCGLPGTASAADPADRSGEWRVYDSSGDGRRDITAEALRAVRPAPAAGPSGSHAVRGFLVPGVR